MKSHGGPNLARGPEFDTHDLQSEVVGRYRTLVSARRMFIAKVKQ